MAFTPIGLRPDIVSTLNPWKLRYLHDYFLLPLFPNRKVSFRRSPYYYYYYYYRCIEDKINLDPFGGLERSIDIVTTI